MAGSTITTLYCCLHGTTGSPTAVKEVFEEWRGRSDLVAAVLQGRTTFEEAVTPLVTANLKPPHSTKNFAALAQEARENLAGVLPLKVSFEDTDLGGWVTLVDLTEPARRSVVRHLIWGAPFVLLPWAADSYFANSSLWPSWYWMILIGLGLGLFCYAVEYVNARFMFPERRKLAGETLARAQFLDRLARETGTADGKR